MTLPLTLNYDADVITYRIGYTTLDVEDEHIVRFRVDAFIDNLRDSLGCSPSTCNEQFFLSDSANNFRFKVFEEYKANRPPKPRWTPYVKDYILQEYGGIIVPYHEADDALAMFQTDDSICISIDKDLLQIPGAHYGMVSHQHSYVEEFDGLRWFYRQLIMGDNTDNISGITGIGAARSDKLLRECETEFELWEKVLETYESKEMDLSIPVRNGKLMWCHRVPVNIETLENIWQPPTQ